MVLCIFIASSVNNLSPLVALAPTLTASEEIRPGMGAARHLHRVGGVGFGAALGLGYNGAVRHRRPRASCRSARR